MFKKKDVYIGIGIGFAAAVLTVLMFLLVLPKSVPAIADVILPQSTAAESEDSKEEIVTEEGAFTETEDDSPEDGFSEEDSSGSLDITTAKKDTDSENSESEPPEEQTGSTEHAKWDAGATYMGGDIVEHKNRLYKCKWWVSGEEPGSSQWGAWEYVGETTPMPEIPEEEIDPVSRDPVAAKDFKVVVYYPSWVENGISKIQFDIVTHINYAFAIPNSDGTLKPLENEALAKKLIDAAHKNSRKVLLAIGGWSYNEVPLEPTFVSATNSPEKIKKFGNEIIAMCDKYGFDGIDMDWEHPRKDDNSRKQYEELMLYLRKELDKKGKLLTSAVLSGATPDNTIYYDAAAHSDAVLKACDWINVMAYDGGDGERHSSYDFAVACAKYWKDVRKLPSYKVVLGVPFYGRPSWASYANILAANPDAYKSDVSSVNGMEAHYNGVPTMKKKAKYARDNLGGVMVWEITQDTTDKSKSLLSAIGEAIK